MSKAYVPRGLNHFKPVLKGIKEKLQELGYKTFFGVLNSKNYKVAQDRKRLFIVAVREDSYRRPFKWPKSQGARSLTSVLDPETSEDVPGRLPANKRSKELAFTVYKKVFNDHKVDQRKTCSNRCWLQQVFPDIWCGDCTDPIQVSGRKRRLLDFVA